MDEDTVQLGGDAVLTHLTLGDTKRYYLVEDGQADHKLSRISSKTPLGRAILGHRAGDVVHFGGNSYRIDAVGSNSFAIRANPMRLRANAYRTLRLPAGASLPDIYAAEARLRRLARLGLQSPDVIDRLLGGTIPSDESDIRSAVGRLGDISLRIQDRLFWLHSVDGHLDPSQFSAVSDGRYRDNPAIRRHDDALRRLVGAVNTELDDAGLLRWTEALRSWCEIVQDGEYWTLSAELDRTGGFEPAANQGDLATLRRRAVRLAAEPLISVGRDAFARDDVLTVKRILGVLDDLEETGRWVASAQAEILAPASERVEASCESIRQALDGVTRSPDGDEDENWRVCNQARGRFESEVRPSLGKLKDSTPHNHPSTRQARETAARCLYTLATALTWTWDDDAVEEVFDAALEYASGLPIEYRVEAGRRRLFGSGE
ncbi:MAG: GreA/GreB family elongation factor [Myxococcota bacterium]|nr:GreA/GreB family elongation factor [Myxococcota bacterium]